MAVVTEAIGIHGWAHLDAVLLAALASEAPLLLIGPHGTAKSLLIERISKVLAMEMRHYNSSLLNYDDLVGIPLPEEDGSRLRFVTTPGAIWDAEFVFFDEISRCRPDLQNKMFPIIHERKVIGMPLTRLRHRWAAMNPPAPDEPNLSAPLTQTYFGSEPLDPALCDRFPFIIPVPNWSDLSKAERKRLVSTHALPPAPLPPARRELADDATIATSAQVEEITMPMLVAQTAELIDPIGAEYGAWLSDYIVTVMDLLSSAQLPQSPRRAAMLMRGIISIHAARMVLEGNEADIERSTEMALLYGLPQTATDVPPTAATVISAHRQAWEICSRSEDSQWRTILEERNPIRRVLLADEMNFDEADMSKLITQALAAADDDARRLSLGTAMFLAFRTRRAFAPSAWEPLAQYATLVLEPRMVSTNLPANTPEMTAWNQIRTWLNNNSSKRDHPRDWLERNYVLAGLPELWKRHNWEKALQTFREDLALFGVEF